jgi:hypothetical protein
MTRFVVVKQVPEKLKKDELVIVEPNFVEEIKIAKNKPASKGRMLTTLNHLKSICGIIGELYDNYGPDNLEGFNPITSVPYSRYVGIEYTDLENLSEKVIKPLFRRHHPRIFEKYIEQKVRGRSPRTKLIYFVGSQEHASTFLKNGIESMLVSDLKSDNE